MPGEEIFTFRGGAGLPGAAVQRPAGRDGLPVFTGEDEAGAGRARGPSRTAHRTGPLASSPGVLGSTHRVWSKAQAVTGLWGLKHSLWLPGGKETEGGSAAKPGGPLEAAAAPWAEGSGGFESGSSRGC